MEKKPAGNEWLKEHFGLHHYSFTHSSFIGNNPSVELSSKGSISQVYGPKYAVAEDKPLPHIEFALKYDDLNLDFLFDLSSPKQRRIPETEARTVFQTE